ncbi:hypothetical protein CIT25_29340 [Mesorhizobium mediterraneum]|uniref:HTH araC/xylS-type domain-containing protein n=1 Tax=Mesorhizobium mediterraneum TaxID=43617 RepID=A0AB36R1N4_9HYPH|nr:hypothetical protein CIT25_29340 [Mesorhizobium mediterraneum]
MANASADPNARSNYCSAKRSFYHQCAIICISAWHVPKRLIEKTELPIVEIAIACGFASASHFSKCFRNAFGTNPSGCRN